MLNDRDSTIFNGLKYNSKLSNNIRIQFLSNFRQFKLRIRVVRFKIKLFKLVCKFVKKIVCADHEYK